MIRKFQFQDLDRVLQLWLEGNLDAHDFVPADYWISNVPMVRELLLQAELSVYELDGEVQGFVGMEGDYLAGIFVDKAHRAMGIGRQLLEHVKKGHPTFTLNVYQRNRQAVAFYRREGLSVIAESLDEETGEKESALKWSGQETGL